MMSSPIRRPDSLMYFLIALQLQVEAFQCGGFVSKYLQTDMVEGCILLSNLFGFDEISDVRLRPYIEAAEQRQRDGMQQQRGRGRPTNASRGKKRGRSR